MSGRVYLDWNATAPLRVEARDAMLMAMDVVGNPSSVHRVRVQNNRDRCVFGPLGQDVVCAAIEHDCVVAHARPVLDCLGGFVEDSLDTWGAQQGANSETGMLQKVQAQRYLTDQVQVAGKLSVSFRDMNCHSAIYSAHKLGGPKGIGALVVQTGFDQMARVAGGGQEMGRRAGTENVIGIAGFGAAAQAAKRDLDAGRKSCKWTSAVTRSARVLPVHPARSGQVGSCGQWALTALRRLRPSESA